jgi:murein DD-endopeptidase MepM/ murein hydrolase activator NlpD
MLAALTIAAGAAYADDGGVGTPGTSSDTATGDDYTFPVRGPHTYGDGFGAGRDHKGQDILADCGTKLVAIHAGRIEDVGYDSYGGGNFLVIHGKRDEFDYVYMHLQGRPAVKKDERVTSGEYVGRVGDTGNATTCHLHLELWTEPGWGKGGEPSPEVTQELKQWDRRR